jgi:hypothetical protein
MPKEAPGSISTDSKKVQWVNAAEKTNALLNAVRSDPTMSKNDLEVCRALLEKLLQRFPEHVIAMSHPDISNASYSSLTIAQVRHSLRKLMARRYFEVLRPSAREQKIGGWTLKYRACLEWQGVKTAA